MQVIFLIFMLLVTTHGGLSGFQFLSLGQAAATGAFDVVQYHYQHRHGRSS